MADVRSLLRQQRASRRITHPFAAYSDAGKLLCSLCREEVKAESFWDQHIKSARHTQRAQQTHHESSASNRHGAVACSDAPQSNKRKHDLDSGTEEANLEEDSVRKKRSRTAMNAPARSGSDSGSEESPPKDAAKEAEHRPALTPPALKRRASVTPSHGIELQIPSRPATPHHRDGTSSASTPLGPPAAISRQTNGPVSQPSNLGALSVPGNKPAGQVDEEEWAAFEADIAATGASYSEDAVISAPAMSAGEHAAATRSLEEEREKRTLAAEQDLVDEKEEATRALEAEFEEMEELEARVRKLKERREALRLQDGTTEANPAPSSGKAIPIQGIGEDEPSEDDEDWDEDDFMGFR